MLLGHASRIRAGMNGDTMMRIKWGQRCNTTQLTLPSLRPWSRCPVDTAQVSQESPDWLSERRERELTLNRKYPRHVIRSHRLQSCVMVIVLYQRRSLHTYCQYCCHLPSFHQLRSPADDSGWSWLPSLEPGLPRAPSLARTRTARPGCSSHSRMSDAIPNGKC